MNIKLKKSFSLVAAITLVFFIGNFSIARASGLSATNLSAAETYTEDTSLNLVDIVVTDTDSSTVTATLTLSNPATGSLSTGTSGAVTSTYNAGTGVWTASGATANVNTLLAGVVFVPASNANNSFTISTSIGDGINTAVSGSKAMTGIPVNDPPTATNLSASQTYTEDTPLTLTAIVASDVDSASVTATLTLSTAAAGSLSTGTSGAVTSTYNAGTGVWTASGVTANVNTLLAGLTFTPTASFSSNFTITTNVSDGSLSVSGSKAMTGVATNSAPVLDATESPALPMVNEDPGAPSGAVGSLVSSLVDFTTPAGGLDNVTDSDNSPSLGIAVTAIDTSDLTCYYSLDNGTGWSLIGPVSSSSAFLLAADSNHRIYCQPGVNLNGTFSSAITFRAWDQTSGTDGSTADTTANGGSTAFSTATETADLVVNAVNDAPTATNLSATETYNENTTLDLINIVANDVDNTTVTATLTLSNPSAGSLSTATSGAATSTYNAGTGVWTASGAIADVNTLLAGVTFVPTASFNSNFTIATSVSDGSLSVTGSKTMTGIPADTTPPETTIDSVNASTIGSEITTFVFSSNESPVTFECSLDAGAYAVCTSPYVTAPLADGDHTFAVRATDASNNTDLTPASRTWTISGVQVSSVSPSNHATGVSVNTQIVFTFSGPVPASFIGHTNISSSPCDISGCPVLDGVWSLGNTILTYTKIGSPFTAGTTYSIQLHMDNGIVNQEVYNGTFDTAVPVSPYSGGGGVTVLIPSQQVAASPTSSNANVAAITHLSSTSTIFVFTKTLKRGVTDAQVIQLQKYLGVKGFEVVPQGKEIDYFGPNTKKQLALFQKSVGIPSTGFFGPITMAYVNSHNAQ